MRFRTVVSLASLFFTLFAVAVWAKPVNSPPSPDSSHSATVHQTVAGQISSVGDASFALDVKKNQDVQHMEFLVDGNTKVEGRLTVGATATVEYNSVGGKNLAVHVVVQQSSGD